MAKRFPYTCVVMWLKQRQDLILCPRPFSEIKAVIEESMKITEADPYDYYVKIKDQEPMEGATAKVYKVKERSTGRMCVLKEFKHGIVDY